MSEGKIVSKGKMLDDGKIATAKINDLNVLHWKTNDRKYIKISSEKQFISKERSLFFVQFIAFFKKNGCYLSISLEFPKPLMICAVNFRIKELSLFMNSTSGIIALCSLYS